MTRGGAGDQWLKENKVSKEKLLAFWDWALENVTDPEVLSGFGYWINPDVEVISDKDVVARLSKTMEISDGDIDWEYGFMKRLSIFAKIDKTNTFFIIKYYLLNEKNELNLLRKPWGLHVEEIKVALDILYKDGCEDDKIEIKKLINILIDKGSSRFWGLKEVLVGKK